MCSRLLSIMLVCGVLALVTGSSPFRVWRQNYGYRVELVSSADLVQTFEAVIGEDGYASHLEASEKIDRIRRDLPDDVAARIQRDIHDPFPKLVREREVQPSSHSSMTSR